MSNHKIVVTDQEIVKLISKHLTPDANNSTALMVSNTIQEFPNLEDVDVFDSPGSCRGITPPRN